MLEYLHLITRIRVTVVAVTTIWIGSYFVRTMVVCFVVITSVGYGWIWRIATTEEVIAVVVIGFVVWFVFEFALFVSIIVGITTFVVATVTLVVTALATTSFTMASFTIITTVSSYSATSFATTIVADWIDSIVVDWTNSIVGIGCSITRTDSAIVVTISISFIGMLISSEVVIVTIKTITTISLWVY